MSCNGPLAWLVVILFGCAASSVAAQQPADGSPSTSSRAAHWIWAPKEMTKETPFANRSYRFERRFQITKPLQAARVTLAADFCRVTLKLNGETVLSVQPYLPVQRLDVTAAMQRGENLIEIDAESAPGPSALAVAIDWTMAGEPTQQLVTDQHWQVAPATKAAPEKTTNTNNSPSETSAAVDLGAVPDEQWGVGRRDISLAADENYEQWRQTLGPDAAELRPKFWTVPGFEISLLRTAAADEGSWISMAFDDRGRLVISREDRGLLRMTLNDARTEVARVEKISVPLDECRGLLFRDGWLYANANNSKAMYRLRLGDDGLPEDLQSLRTFPGGVGHGRNDLAVSATGLLAIHGDSVETPATDVIDLTSPLRETRRTKPGREGYVVRTSWDGKAWEIVCSGLRNPYGIAEHPSGDRFTFDADNEYDMGTPWYRPTRIVHLVPGGDTGYREAGGVWPPRFHDQPDATPPVLDIGRSSPTSVMFGSSLQFPEAYRQCLYALDWTYGRVLAIHLSARGAGWRGESELFLQGRPLNVTDLAAGPDGAMYLITGGRKTQSSLYRVSWSGKSTPSVTSNETGSPTSPASTSAHEQDTQRFSDHARERRHRLEEAARESDVAARNSILGQLADTDPMIRHAARIALERLPIVEWRDRVLAAPVEAESLYGWLALARASRGEDAGPIIERVARLSPKSLTVGQQLIWIRLVQLCRKTSPESVSPHRDSLVAHLKDLLLDGQSVTNNSAKAGVVPRVVDVEGTNDEVRRRAALLLGEFAASELPSLAVPPLLASKSQEDRIAGLLALADQRTGWNDALRVQQLIALRDSAFFVGGQGMPEFLDRLRTSTLATLSDAERRDHAELLKPPAISDEPLPATRPVVRRWTLAELETIVANAARGDAARGEQTFKEALCSRCHRVGILGPAVGPDLTHVGRRFSPRDILESIVTPSLSVAENYRNSQVITEDGKVHVGRVVTAGDYRSQALRINTDPLRPGQYVEFDKREIAEYRLTESSPMPTGLLDGFNENEIRDLVAYLTNK